MKKIGLLGLILCAGALNAQTIVTDRPSQSNSSTVIPKSSLQLETGASVFFTPSGTTSSSQIVAPSTLFRYGVSKYFEFRALTQFESFKSPANLTRTSGISDLQLGIKIRLLDEEDENTKIAWVSHLAIPTGSRGITADEFSTINSLAVSHVLADNINLFYNVGYDVYMDRYGDATYSLGFGFNVTEKVNFFVEQFGRYNGLNTFQAGYDGGLTYLLKDNAQLDFSYGAGLNYKMNFFSVGFSWNAFRNTEANKEDTITD